MRSWEHSGFSGIVVCGRRRIQGDRPIRSGLDHDPDSGLLNQTPELTFVDIDTFMATF